MLKGELSGRGLKGQLNENSIFWISIFFVVVTWSRHNCFFLYLYYYVHSQHIN